MIDTPCIIFAGGKSSRMGEDKALLPFANFPTLTQYQYERLKKIFHHVYISAKEGEKFDFLQGDKKNSFIEDIALENVYAPTTGFVSVFEALHVSINEIFVLSVDTPFVGEEEILAIFAHKNEPYDAIIAKTPLGNHPMCGIYKRGLHGSFKKMLKENNHKLTKLLKESNTLFVNFNNEAHFSNLNTKEEYQQALLQLHSTINININK